MIDNLNNSKMRFFFFFSRKRKAEDGWPPEVTKPAWSGSFPRVFRRSMTLEFELLTFRTVREYLLLSKPSFRVFCYVGPGKLM